MRAKDGLSHGGFDSGTDAQAVFNHNRWGLDMRVLVGNVEHNLKVSACLSIPRLGFQDNFFTVFSAFSPHGIKIVRGSGAFWDQTMSRLFEELCSDEADNDFIVTCDYDSVFEPDCLTRLMAAMLVSGVDCIAPLQMKRDDKQLMFTPIGLAGKIEGKHEISLPPEWWEQPAQLVDTAHFGLTIIRKAALLRTKKPWFHGKLNEKNEWGDGRTDPDIAFWTQFRESGNTLAICPQVAIGHAELVINWPDQRLKAMYQYPSHYWADGGNRPPEAWGSREHAKKSTGSER